MTYTKEDIEDYKNKITCKQEEELIVHVNEHGIKPRICAWYDDMEDFYTDWVTDNKIYDTKKEALKRYEDGVVEGEFKKFKNGEIVRLNM